MFFVVLSYNMLNKCFFFFLISLLVYNRPKGKLPTGKRIFNALTPQFKGHGEILIFLIDY